MVSPALKPIPTFVAGPERQLELEEPALQPLELFEQAVDLVGVYEDQDYHSGEHTPDFSVVNPDGRRQSIQLARQSRRIRSGREIVDTVCFTRETRSGRRPLLEVAAPRVIGRGLSQATGWVGLRGAEVVINWNSPELQSFNNLFHAIRHAAIGDAIQKTADEPLTPLALAQELLDERLTETRQRLASGEEHMRKNGPEMRREFHESWMYEGDQLGQLRSKVRNLGSAQASLQKEGEKALAIVTSVSTPGSQPHIKRVPCDEEELGEYGEVTKTDAGLQISVDGLIRATHGEFIDQRSGRPLPSAGVDLKCYLELGAVALPLPASHAAHLLMRLYGKGLVY